MIKFLFPSTIIFLSLGAAFVYLLKKDYPNAIYWFAAATLNAAITFR